MNQDQWDARLIDAIRAASQRLAETHERQILQGPAGTTPRMTAQLNPDIIAPIVEQLSTAPHLETICSSYLVGFGRYAQKQMNVREVASHLAARTLQVLPEEAVSELAELAALNRATARLTAIIAGVTVDEALALGDDIQLVPFDWRQIKAGITSIRRPLAGDIVDKIAPEPSSFLVWDFQYQPVFETANEKQGPFPQEMVTRLTSIADRLAVIANHEVAVLEMWIEGNDPRLPAELGRVTFRDPSWGTGPVLEAVAIDRKDAVEFLAQCERFNRKREWEALEVAMSRLNISRRSVRPEDRAIDLGTILEVLLMHGSGIDNTEISYKLGTRGAWAMGDSVESREQLFRQIRKLYGNRSQAVHSGRLKHSDDVLYDYLVFEAESLLVIRLIREIVARGHFPDWTTLVLGGGWIDPK